ncbi:hypothetical protein AHAS_Ahas18G0135800 [Arachis hypogaea]
MIDANKAQANSLYFYGVRTCHIIGFMMVQKEGPNRTIFTKKDLYNHFDRSRRTKIKDGDAHAAVSYLISKVDEPTIAREVYFER